MDKHIFIRKVIYCFLSIVLMGIGIYLMLRPDHSIMAICNIIGVVLVAFGVIKIIGYFTKDMYELAFQFDLATGIFSIIIGMLFVLRTEHVLQLVSAFVGVFVLLDSLFKNQIAIDAKRFGLKKWWLILGIAVITNIAGLLLLFKPIEAVSLILRLIGLNLILDGGLNLLVVLYTVKSTKVNRWRCK